MKKHIKPATIFVVYLIKKFLGAFPHKKLPKIVRSRTVSLTKYDIFEFDSKGPEGRREQQMRTELKAVCIYGKTEIDHLFP